MFVLKALFPIAILLFAVVVPEREPLPIAILCEPDPALVPLEPTPASCVI